MEHPTIEARKAYLYDPARLEERFRHFEAMTLPSISAQSDEDFQFLILIGEDFPKPFHDRLMDLTAPVEQIKIVKRAPGNHRKVCQEVINSHRDDEDFCLQFRHDDDDAVATSYVAALRDAFDNISGLMENNRLVGIDHNRGFVARPDAQGIAAEEQVTLFWGVAQAVAVRPWVRQTIMNFGHNKLPYFMPTLTFTDSPMYVRGHNDFNDSRQKKHVKPVDLPRLDALGEEVFKETFNICSNRVREIFGAPLPSEGE